jgi:type II secretory pathway pseudopilin PulG
MEIIVVIVILGILSTIGIPRYFSRERKTEAQTAFNNLKAIYTAQQLYFERMQLRTAGAAGSYLAVGAVDNTDLAALNAINGPNSLNIESARVQYYCTAAQCFAYNNTWATRDYDIIVTLNTALDPDWRTNQNPRCTPTDPNNNPCIW